MQFPRRSLARTSSPQYPFVPTWYRAIIKGKYIRRLVGVFISSLKIMKKISSLILLFLFILAPTVTVFAAGSLETPQVDIIAIKLLSQTFKSGDTISGTFTVVNGSTFDVPDISYTITLTGNYVDSIPTESYDSKRFGPISLKAQEVRSVPFLYKLPEAVSGNNLGIQIRNFLKSGVPMGWKDSLITVTGGSAFAKVTDAYVAIGDKRFDLQAGPVVKKEETASLVVTLSNTDTAPLSLIPTVTISAQSALGKNLSTQAGAPLNIPIKNQQTATFPLPTFSYSGGVYSGVVSFVDAGGVTRAPSVSFRYIVAGPIGSIESVTTKTVEVKKGDVIPLTVNITGAPYDIETGESVMTGTGQLALSLFNEKDELVGKSETVVNLGGSASQDLRVDALFGAQALRAEATLSYKGSVVSSYKNALSARYDDEKAKALLEVSNQIPIVPIAVVAGVLIIGILVMVGVYKKKVPASTLVFIFLVGVLAIFLSTNSSSSHVEAAKARKKKAVIATGFKPDGKKVLVAQPTGKGTPWEDIVAGIEAGKDNAAIDVDDASSVNQKFLYENLTPAQQAKYDSNPAFAARIDKRAETSSDLAPEIYVASPKGNPEPGSQFTIMLSVYSPACFNSPADVTASVDLSELPGNASASSNTKTKKGGGHGYHVFTSDFAFGPFTVPTEPGVYNIPIQVINKVNLGQRAGVTNGHITIVVPDPDITPSCEDDDSCPTPISCEDDDSCPTPTPVCEEDDSCPTPTLPPETGLTECLPGDLTCPRPRPTPKPVVCNLETQIVVDNKCVPRPRPAVIDGMKFTVNPSLVSRGNQCSFEAELNSNYTPVCKIEGNGFTASGEILPVVTSTVIKPDGTITAKFSGSLQSHINGGIQSIEIFSLGCTSSNGIKAPNHVWNGDSVAKSLTAVCKINPSGSEQ